MALKRREIILSDREGTVTGAAIENALRAVHVIPQAGEGWTVRTLCHKRISRDFGTQREAVRFADNLARRRGASEVVIHRRKGRVQVRAITPEGAQESGSKAA